VDVSDRPATTALRTRRRTDGVAAVAALAVLVLGMVAVRHGSVSAPERRIFHAINDLPGALYPVLWPFQQLGVLIAGPIVALVALAARKWCLALAAVLATVAKLLLERLVKAVVSRQRPATSIGRDIHLRGNAPMSGESFVSGHAVLVTALAMVIAPYVSRRWRVVLVVLVALVCLTRVYVGAHNPLDVVCGAALGLAIGGMINLGIGVPPEVRR